MVVYNILSTKKIDSVLLFTANGFSFLEKGLMAILASWFGKKVVLAPRTEMVGIEAQQSKWRKLFTKYVLKCCNTVVCQGRPVKNILMETLADDNKYAIIPNWIDTDAYLHNRPEYTTTNTDTVNMLFLGWIDQYWKGVFDIIKVAEKIKNLNFILHFGGNGVDLEAAKQQVNAAGLTDKVVFHGWVNNEAKMELLRKSDIFVLPSHSEGYPNALIEAMVSAVPSVASNVGCISDIIQQGENGFILPVADTIAWANTLQKLIENANLRIQIAQAGRKTVLDRNNRQQNTNDLLAYL